MPDCPPGSRGGSSRRIVFCQDLIAELEQRFGEHTHHSVVRLPALRALLAYRQKDYHAALKEAGKPAPVRKDIPVVARRLKEDRGPDRWVARALAHAALGEGDEARLALEKGRAALDAEVEWEPGVFLSIKILAREAERAIGSAVWRTNDSGKGRSTQSIQ